MDALAEKPLALPLCPRCGAAEHDEPGPCCWLRQLLEGFLEAPDDDVHRRHWFPRTGTVLMPDQMEELRALLADLEDPAVGFIRALRGRFDDI